MSDFHTATIRWQRGDAVFTDRRYSRAHTWAFDSGAVVPASSSPHVVPVPMSDASAVDPEEAFVAALSSCHMLWCHALALSAAFAGARLKPGARLARALNRTMGALFVGLGLKLALATRA